MKKKKKKGTVVKLLEYSAASLVIRTARVFPLNIVRAIGNLLGDLCYVFVPKRRTIAIENLRHAFKGEKDERQISTLARKSCRSFFLTFLEIIKLGPLFNTPGSIDKIRRKAEGVDSLFLKAKKIHDDSGGCIFVTPHIGNWELLPRVSSFVGIPLAVVARPLDNEYLEKLILRNRIGGGQILIPKKNALFTLQKTLQKGTSIGMLPDQSTMKGIVVDFFGRPATTTPIPAILAITFHRPVVVVAACRKEESGQYDGFVSDPIWPGEFSNEKDEIYRITKEMTRSMEEIIRKYPEQYLWMHNRWKTYRGKRAVLS